MQTRMNGHLNNQPLVSVVIPVYNAERYLRDSLNSIVQQSYENQEILCLDDGSTDNSAAILEEFKKHDKRIKVYKNRKNIGVGYTAQRLCELAKGKYIARMDADDVSFLNRIEKQVKFLEENPETVALGGQCITIDTTNHITGFKVFPLEHEKIYKMLYTAVSIQQGTIMINKNLLPENYLWYDNSLSPMDDLDFFFRLFSFGKVANLPDFVLEYREYSKSSSLKDPKRSFYLTYNIRKKATKECGYIPTAEDRFFNLLQYLTVSLLPSYFIFPVFKLFRKIKTRKLLEEILAQQDLHREDKAFQEAKESIKVGHSYEVNVR